MKEVILLKSRSNHQGGLEKHASRIANAFVANGAKVTILTTGTTPTTQPNISVFGTQTWSWPPFLRMEQFDCFVRKWLEKNRADLVFGMDRNRYQTHIRAGNGVHAAYLKSRFFTDTLVKSSICHLNPLHRKILSLEKAAFENRDLRKLFTNSEMVKKQILEYYKVDPIKIQVIHNGVEWFEMQEDFSDWQKQWVKESPPFHFLFVGNGYSRKGLDRLLFALSQIKEPYQLSVIGKDNRIDKYRKLAHRLKIQNNVVFLGQIQEMRPFYKKADCLVIPSFYDPFANVTIEAMAMGLFVVSSKHNGGHEIITPENGAVIENLLEPDSLIEALQLAMKRPKTTKSAESIRESVKKYDFSNQLKILMEACG